MPDEANARAPSFCGQIFADSNEIRNVFPCAPEQVSKQARNSDVTQVAFSLPVNIAFAYWQINDGFVIIII